MLFLDWPWILRWLNAFAIQIVATALLIPVVEVRLRHGSLDYFVAVRRSSGDDLT
jgi:hypothetical protein